MQLDPETIRQLAKMTLETKPKEISCEDWIHRVGEYIEASRKDAPMEDRLQVVERHSAECPSCAEELAALRAVIEDEE